jgi:peptide/nickel transport system ATP-binding protein
VMYAGRIVEHAPAEQIFGAPQHPYTWGLLKSIPRLDTPRDEALVPIAGRPPSLIKRPTGCFFHPRCPYAREAHTRIDPKREPVPGDPGHEVACLLEPDVRARIWKRLAAGESPDVVRRDVANAPPSFVATEPASGTPGVES